MKRPLLANNTRGLFQKANFSLSLTSLASSPPLSLTLSFSCSESVQMQMVLARGPDKVKGLCDTALSPLPPIFPPVEHFFLCPRFHFFLSPRIFRCRVWHSKFSMLLPGFSGFFVSPEKPNRGQFFREKFLNFV